MSSFSNKKNLRFVITLGTGKFGASDANVVTMEGRRASVDIDKAGGMAMGTMTAKIFGVSQSDMNSVVTLTWKPTSLIKNTVQVFAIDGKQETLIFAGNIINAWGNYTAMPDVFLHIKAVNSYFAGLSPVRPLSLNGSVEAATVMQRIADGMGLKFENNNVTTRLFNPYLASTLKEQAIEVARAANFDLYIDDTVLAITNRYAPREGLIPTISKDTGMAGYPTFDGVGVNVTSIFNPAIIFGGSVNVETDLPHARGQWVVTSMAYQLSSETPNGPWFVNFRGTQNDFAISRR